MSSVFLLVENINHLKATVERYFLERLGVTTELPDYDALMRSVMTTVVHEVRMRKCQDDLATMNRRVLFLLIPMLVERHRSLNDVETGPEMAGPEMTMAAPGKDVTFMEKLEELEQSRRLPLEKLGGQGVTPLSTMDVLVPQTPVGGVSSIPSIQTVFIPTAVRKGSVVWIQSWQRNWIQYPHRNGFQWAGAIPQGADLTQSKVVCILIPMIVMKLIHTPYVVLHIEGAGGASVQLFFTYEGTCADANGRWGKYIPMAPETNYMRTMACPWKVKLLTASGKTIPMGWDGQTVQWRRDTRTFAVQQKHEWPTPNLRMGDECWMFGSNGLVSQWTVTKDVGILEDGMGHYQGTWEDTSKTMDEGQLLSFTHQWCVMMDIVKKDT